MIRLQAFIVAAKPSAVAARAVKLWLARFRRHQEGATAIEFGIVAMPFFAVLFAIIETALSLWTTQVLETAVTDAARRIYTGQFQQANAATSPEQLPVKFREELCKSIVALFSCADIKVDVRTFDSFPAGAAAPPVTPDGEFDNENFGQYQCTPTACAGPNKIVVVRAAVEYPVFASLLNPNQTNLKNGKRLVMGTATFRTEPFGQ
jgi:Flp pilus assembly protein TadG